MGRVRSDFDAAAESSGSRIRVLADQEVSCFERGVRYSPAANGANNNVGGAVDPHAITATAALCQAKCQV